MVKFFCLICEWIDWTSKSGRRVLNHYLVLLLLSGGIVDVCKRFPDETASLFRIVPQGFTWFPPVGAVLTVVYCGIFSGIATAVLLGPLLCAFERALSHSEPL